MALLAEELVEEWLNRQGYFTIRGTKVGVHEIDLLAIRHTDDGIECRHLEVQASVNPVSYITKVPQEVQRDTGRAAGSAKVRDDEELRKGINEWIDKKYDHPKKEKLRSQLAPGIWSRELVVNVVKHQREIELLAAAGINIIKLSTLVNDLKTKNFLLDGASGTHLVGLVAMAASNSNEIESVEQDLLPIVALPNARFGKGERRIIWEFVSKNPNSTIIDIAKKLNSPISDVRTRINSMVADLKLAPASFDYTHFPLKSSINAVTEKLQGTTYSVVARRLFEQESKN